ncbi:amino acid ABC transporter substrate-binding protein [Salinarimonas rosea]|uniref:amino acid ABC transporter substrate-binding protein n=1 Tax=Salinarimonas rosea TaxID=552063 RepID=UPI00041C428D|nr:amino acid ABC transporter substrate-binding protein [Salinarimonas rosea]
MKTNVLFRLIAGTAALLPVAAQAGPTLDAVKARGVLNCGVSTGTSIGKSTLDDSGNWTGFEADFCRAVAAAILGDATAVEFVPLEFKNAFASLQSGSVDMLARSATWTLSRDAELGFEWAGVYLYDGQGFLVSKASGVTSAEQLDGASICVTSGTTTELNLADYFRTKGMSYTPITVGSPDQSIANLEAGRCDAYTNEVGGLASYRLGLSDPAAYTILPDVISKEPLGPVVRQDDPQFEDVVEWTLYALVIAEEFGLTKDGVAQAAATTQRPEMRRFLGAEGEFGAKLGLPNDWAVKVIQATGNYGELFERTLGSQSDAGIARGVNRLWSEGGLLYAPPVR